MNYQSSEDRATVLLEKQKALTAELQSGSLPEERILKIRQELVALYEEQAKIIAGTDNCSIQEMDLYPAKATIEVLSDHVFRRFHLLCPSCDLKVERGILLIDSEDLDKLKLAQDRWQAIAEEANDLGIDWVKIGRDNDGFPAVIAEAYLEEG